MTELIAWIDPSSLLIGVVIGMALAISLFWIGEKIQWTRPVDPFRIFRMKRTHSRRGI